MKPDGTWRSLAAHLLWEQGVAGSNPAVPTLPAEPTEMTRLHQAQRRADPTRRYIAPLSVQDAIAALNEHGDAARAIAGGTDLILELSRGSRSGIDTIVDLSVIAGLDTIVERDGRVELGPLVTHGDVVGHERMRAVALPLAQACLEVGSPQLRNRATVAGNVVTASPANDTISALYALRADIELTGAHGTRSLPISRFFDGFRSTVLQSGELVTKISFEALSGSSRGVFAKLGLRSVQAISVVHAAAVVTEDPDGVVRDLTVALGSVGPTIVEVETAGDIARGRRLADAATDVSEAARDAASPIDDLRASAEYRSHGAEVAVRRALLSLAARTESLAWPDRPPLLRSNRCFSESTPSRQSTAGSTDAAVHAVKPCAAARTAASTSAASQAASAQRGATDAGSAAQPRSAANQHSDMSARRHGADVPAAANQPPRSQISDTSADRQSAQTGPSHRGITDDDTISATVNGTPHAGANAVGRTLLDWLRLDLGLTGTKEGCAEGECGACTVHMDGQAVLACLVPAARAAGTRITTVEGVASAEGGLHRVQQALAAGGVQCGFCTPGFVMSAAMLNAENPTPSRAQVVHGLSGNLCRCTGYYPIIDALAAEESKPSDSPRTR